MGWRESGALILGALALSPATANAGAWIAPEGGQSIQSQAVGERAAGYVLETQLFFEQPVAQRTSVVARPWLETGWGVGESGWRAEAEAGLKQALLRTDRGAVAVQATALWSSHPGVGCGEGGVELRALGGASFAQGRGFLNAEAGRRALEGGCEAFRVDVSSGWRFTQSWLGMAEAFSHQEPAGDATVKAQLSLVRFDDEGRGIQLGVRVRVDGQEPEPALVLAFWRGR